MKTRSLLALGIATSIGFVTGIAHAQTSTTATTTAKDKEQAAEDIAGDVPSDQKNDIIVVGIRGSVESAANAKRTSKQIVDSIVSEDVGKLPDNNVVDALARIPGVQIDRARGQGQSVTIRGLDGIQTTINGNSTSSGVGRGISLSDIPAELLKSVDVYKTRTADQVEGGIAGAINVELRRPLDFTKGFTVAGSVKGVHDDISKKVSPYLSGLVVYRGDTGIGEIGAIANVSWTRNYYFENFVESESPDVVCCRNPTTGVAFANTPAVGLPAGFNNLIVPYRVYYGLEEGKVTRPSVNLGAQWRVNDRLDFVLEGGYFGADGYNSSDSLYLLTREGGGLVYSNIKVRPDNRTVESFQLTNPNGLIAGIGSTYNHYQNDLYTTNFETHFRAGRAQINASVQYNWSTNQYYFVQQNLRPNSGIRTANVNFFSPQYGAGIPAADFPGIDLTSAANYGLERFQDNGGRDNNKEFAAQADLTLQTSDTGLLRNLQTGFRYSRRNNDRYYGYRDGYPRVNGQFAPLSSIPGGDQASLIGPQFPGSPRWLRIPGQVLLDRVSDVLAFVRQTDPGNAARFTGDRPPSDRGQTFTSTENTFAAYAQLNYATKLGFPIDGTVGVRYTNTWGNNTSFDFRPGNAANGFEDIVNQSAAGGNYVDVLPNASAILHFTPKVQLRLNYSAGVQRPGFYEIRPFYFAETRAVPPVVFAGNPDLKAQREHSYNFSAEYYFGRGGQLTLGGYYKKVTGFLYYSREPVADLSRYGIAGAGFVEQLRNAGDGEFMGLEATAQTFFDFLPGFLSHFGVNLNGAYVHKARVEYPYPEDFPGAFDSPGNSKYTANAILLYDTPKLSGRLALNYRSAFRLGIFPPQPAYSPYQDDTYRLDAAVNWTPVKFMTLSLEGGNILGNDVYRFFGKERLIPLGVRTLGRTVQGSVRFRF